MSGEILMTIASPVSLFTPDDVLKLEDESLNELVDGKLVEKNISSLANRTAGLIASALIVHCHPRGLGEVYPEQTFQCFPEDPDRIRRPDVSFIAADRASGVDEEGHIRIHPDIAIEVVSPTDKIYELDKKLIDYRSAGVKLVWVVNPNARTLRIHRPDHSLTELIETDTLSGESVLPDFSVKLSEVLPPKSVVS
jgi:Uma2 family endonuclease